MCFALPDSDTPGSRPDIQGFMSRVSGLLPRVSEFWMQTHFCCVHKLSYAFTLVFRCTHTHPTVNYIKSNFDLYLVAIIWHLKSQNWNSSSWHTLRGSSLYTSELHMFWLSNAVHGVVINHQKEGDWKISRPLSGFWCLMTKPCMFNVVI